MIDPEAIDPEALLEEKLMLDEIATLSHEMIPRLPVGHHGNPNQYPLGKRAGLNTAVPLPAGTTDEEWDDYPVRAAISEREVPQLCRASRLCSKGRLPVSEGFSTSAVPSLATWQSIS